MKKAVLFFLLFCLLWEHLQAQADAYSPYYLYMACVRPLARLNATRQSYPGHIFLGYVLRDKQGLDSVVQYCGNQPAPPLLKNFFKKEIEQVCLQYPAI